MRKLAFLAAASLAAFVATSASAQTATYSLSVAEAAGLGAGPFGTVTVTQNGNGTLTFTETLAAGYRIHQQTGSDGHDAFAFRLIGDPGVTISGLPAGFTTENLTSGSTEPEPPFGDFYTAINYSGGGPGYAGGFAGPLTFTVGRTDMTALTLASLGFSVYNGQNIYFTSDLIRNDQNGSTGNVGATFVGTTSVPEPATWAMMLIGFGATGAAMRRTRKKVALSQLA